MIIYRPPEFVRLFQILCLVNITLSSNDIKSCHAVKAGRLALTAFPQFCGKQSRC